MTPFIQLYIVNYFYSFQNIISSSSYVAIKSFEIESNKHIKESKRLLFSDERLEVCCIKHAFENKILIGLKNGQIKIFNTETKENIDIINVHTDSINSILVINDNNQFVTCSNDKTIKLFDINSLDCIRTFIGHEKLVNDIDKISNEKIVSCSFDCTIRIWNLNDKHQCLKIIHSYYLISFVRVLSDKIIACACRYTSGIYIWNVETGICLNAFTNNVSNTISIIRLSNEQIATGDTKGLIKIWDINNWGNKCFKTIEAHTDHYIMCLAKLSKNLIISSTQNGPIKIWDTDTGSCLKTFHVYSDLNFIDLF